MTEKSSPIKIPLNQVINQAAAIKVSDIHIQANKETYIRMPNGLRPVEGYEWTVESTHQAIKNLVGEEKFQEYIKTGEADGSYSTPDDKRVRVNCYKNKGEPGIVMRILPTPPTLADLGMEEDLKPFLHWKDGLIIVTGPTGSGKSSTLAAIMQYLNENRRAHIVTLEDPIEYVYTAENCVVTQREIGSDTLDFKQALRRVLRQDPDIIVVGEARDAETLKAALSAAETGHLVFTTLHAINVPETISRVMEMFPSEEHNHIRGVLAGVLRGVIAQRLLPTVDNKRVALQEIMVGTMRATDVIKDPEKSDELIEVIQGGSREGMRTFNQALVELVREEKITVETAFESSQAKQDLKLMLEYELGKDKVVQKDGDISYEVQN